MTSIKLLEGAGSRNSNEIDKGSLESVRESMRAEVNLMLSQRLEEVGNGLEERVGKRFDEFEKKLRGLDKKSDSYRSEIDEHKKQQDEIFAKVEDLGKLVGQIVTGTSQQQQADELSKLRFILENVKMTVSNFNKYREEDSKKVEQLYAIIEENKKAES